MKKTLGVAKICGVVGASIWAIAASSTLPPAAGFVMASLSTMVLYASLRPFTDAFQAWIVKDAYASSNNRLIDGRYADQSKLHQRSTKEFNDIFRRYSAIHRSTDAFGRDIAHRWGMRNQMLICEARNALRLFKNPNVPFEQQEASLNEAAKLIAHAAYDAVVNFPELDTNNTQVRLMKDLLASPYLDHDLARQLKQRAQQHLIGLEPDLKQEKKLEPFLNQLLNDPR